MAAVAAALTAATTSVGTARGGSLLQQTAAARFHDELFWVDRWLRCVPLEGEAQGFFAALPRAIGAGLRASACIPTEDGVHQG